MEDKYKQIYEQLKEETKNTLENKNSDKFVDEFKQIVKDRLKEVHEKLDKKRDELIKLALEAYNKEISGIVDPKEEELIKKVIKSDKKEEVEVANPTTFKGKIKSLIGDLDSVLDKTQSLEETIKIFKENNLSQLLEFKDGDFFFKHERKLKYRLMGKVYWDLGWSKNMNKPTNSDIDKTQEKVLNVHSNSCYNYFTTDKPITEESVLVIFETNIQKSDGYFYFGVANEMIDYNNNCMCCTTNNCTYIRCNGTYIESAQSKTNNSVRFDQGSSHIIEIRVLGKEKKVYFKVDEFEEQGPYTMTGSKFTITSGSCNTANGLIKIVSSVLVG